MGKHSKSSGESKPVRISGKDVKGFTEAIKRTAGKAPTKHHGAHRKEDQTRRKGDN